jgi:hypothetical protein
MRGPSLFLLVVLVAAALLVAGAPRAYADAGDRAATRILDAVPLPATAQPDDLDDRSRSYTSTDGSETVLEFFRAQLRATGWTERSVSRASPNNGTLGREEGGRDQGTTGGGSESSGEGTPGSEDAGTGGTSNQQITGPTRGRWTMRGATLLLRIDDIAIGDQQMQGESGRPSTFVLRVRLSS